MRNERMYKKQKHELTLNFLYNTNKHHKPMRQTLWNICKYFQIEFNNQRYNVISTFAYRLGLSIRAQTHYLFYNDEMLMNYANTHNIKLYDMKEHKVINSV